MISVKSVGLMIVGNQLLSPQSLKRTILLLNVCLFLESDNVHTISWKFLWRVILVFCNYRIHAFKEIILLVLAVQSNWGRFLQNVMAFLENLNFDSTKCAKLWKKSGKLSLTNSRDIRMFVQKGFFSTIVYRVKREIFRNKKEGHKFTFS